MSIRHMQFTWLCSFGEALCLLSCNSSASYDFPTSYFGLALVFLHADLLALVEVPFGGL